MPLINIKVFQDELNAQQASELIDRVTAAVTAVTSERLREATWVIIDEVRDGHWGVGGSPIGLSDVKAMMAETNSFTG